MKEFVYCENKNFNMYPNDEYYRYSKTFQEHKRASLSLEIGKKYEVVNCATKVDEIAIKSKFGWTVHLPKSFFMDEVSYLRQQKINQILKT